MILSFRYRFEAAHRLPGGKSRCSTPHGHSWWVTLSLKHSATAIDLKTNFAKDFSELKKDWKLFVDEELDHFFFANSEDPLIGFLNELEPSVRIKKIPGDPTTEMLAALFFRKAESLFVGMASIDVESIFLEETPTNSVRVSKEDTDGLLGRHKLPPVNWWS